MTIVTRFAPSPTGYLHIGSLRTAIFNWLYARHHGGRYLLRIEDTDKSRSTAEATQAILDGLAWLGLDHEGDAYHQSAFEDNHKKIAHQLLENGKAYRCYHTPEELDAKREEAKKNGDGRPIRSDWRDKIPEQAPDGADYVIRLRAPDTGKTIIHDAIQGDVTFDNALMDDMVLLRADGTPTYMLAVVVDDHQMGITHVIRGDDHLNNAARQTLIYQALGWDIPQFAHMPLMHGADGAKLSKRHGALSVLEYKQMGILPDALFNYLLRMGWSHGDDEIISREQAITWFDLDAVGRSPSSFDEAKLLHLNAHYIQEASPEYLFAQMSELSAELHTLNEKTKNYIILSLDLFKPRVKHLLELIEQTEFFIHYQCDEKSQSLLKDAEVQSRLKALHEELEQVTSWDKETLDSCLKNFVEQHELKFKDIGLPLRAAIVGRTNSPSITDIMVILGKERSLSNLHS